MQQWKPGAEVLPSWFVSTLLQFIVLPLGGSIEQPDAGISDKTKAQIQEALWPTQSVPSPSFSLFIVKVASSSISHPGGHEDERR